MTLNIDNLICHRFRGFAPRENTLAGLTAALDFGAVYLEFDIRVAACGTPMVYHDEYAYDGNAQKRHLCDIKAANYAGIGGDFVHFPSLESLLQTVAAHPNKGARLLVDIKDAGFETEITSLVRLFRLQDRVTYVSWLPDALYRCHALEPDAPLCLSHWCKPPDASIRAKHKVFTAKAGHVPLSGQSYIHGIRMGWFVDGMVSGDMLDMLKSTSGSVCVPKQMVTKNLVEQYHAQNIEVSTFGYTDIDEIMAHKNTMSINQYFVDNYDIFAKVGSV